MAFDIKILATGSSGNCIIIDDAIMFDTGVANKYFEKYGKNVKYVFLTHRHTDHTNKRLLNYIAKKKPYILQNGLFANEDTFNFLLLKVPKIYELSYNKNKIIDETFNKIINVNSNIYKIEAFELEHDVENYGFVITNQNGEKLLFATDTSHVKNAPNIIYDYILLEGNYDENHIIESLESEDFNEQMRAIRNLRHLSMQSFETFVLSHSHKDTKVYQLHESMEYGLRSNLGINYLPYNLEVDKNEN